MSDRRNRACTPRPPSKTALFEAKHPIASTPTVHVIAVKILSAPETGAQDYAVMLPVGSHQLRRAVIEEWVSENLFGDETVYAIKYHAEKDDSGMKLDWILTLVPGPSKVDEDTLDMTLEGYSEKVEVKRKVRNALGALDEYALTCTVHKRYRADPDYSEYWKFLDAILRQQVIANGIEIGTRSSTGEVLLKVVEKPPPKLLLEAVENPPPESLTAMSARPTQGTSPELSVLIRAEGSVEALGLKAKYKVELDLVPGVREGKNLVGFVYAVCGCYPVSKSSLVDLRKLLRGMEVKKKRAPPGFSTDPVFTIRDVRLPGSVDPFWYKNQKISVQKYSKESKFRSPEDPRSWPCANATVVILKGKKLQHPKRPLARTGATAWVPLEMLLLAHTQKISKTDKWTLS
jgi:hypothetical protein